MCLHSEQYGDVAGQSDRVKEIIEQIMAIGQRLLPKIKDIEVDKIGDIVDKELQQTTDAIEQAAKRFEVTVVVPPSLTSPF